MSNRAPRISPKNRRNNQATDSTDSNTPEPFTGNEVAVLAYQIWQQRGCPIGSGKDDWFQAEKELKERTGLTSTLPAAAFVG